MKRRFVRTIVGLGILAASAGAVVAGAPAASDAHATHIDQASTSLPIPVGSRLWATLLGLGTAGAAAMALAQRRQHALEVNRKKD